MNLTLNFSESELAIISNLSDVKLGRILRAFMTESNGGQVDLKGDLALVYALLRDRQSMRQNDVKGNEISVGDSKKEKQEKKETFPSDSPLKKENNKKKECVKKDSKESKKNSEDSEFGPSEKSRKKESPAAARDGKAVALEISEPFANFIKWMNEAAPAVYKQLGQKMTDAEFTRLRAAMPAERLADYVLQIENNRQYLKRYRSLYLTIVNWVKRDYAEQDRRA